MGAGNFQSFILSFTVWLRQRLLSHTQSAMVGVDERSPLLVDEEVVHVQNSQDDTQESTVAEPHPDYGASLRRYSSAAGLPPYHQDHPPAKEPSSNLAIWTVIPILLIGKTWRALELYMLTLKAFLSAMLMVLWSSPPASILLQSFMPCRRHHGL
jgi:hypothetical protein